MVSTPVIHVITWITTHLPTQKGWKAELAWLVRHRSGKVRQLKTDVLTTEPRHQLAVCITVSLSVACDNVLSSVVVVVVVGCRGVTDFSATTS